MQPITTTKMEVTKIRAEPKTIGTADLRCICYAIKSGWQDLCDKLGVLLEPCHTKQCGQIRFEI